MTPLFSRHRLETLAFRIVTGLWGWLPERVALRSGAALGLLLGSVVRIRRTDVDRHLRWAFPDQSSAWRRRVARASYAHLGQIEEAAEALRRARELRPTLDANVALAPFAASGPDLRKRYLDGLRMAGLEN